MAISLTAAASSTTTTSSAFFLQYFVTTVLAIITFPQQVFMFSPKCQVAVDSWQHVVCVKWPLAAAATVWCATFSVRWLMNHETTTDGSILQHNTILEGGCCCCKKVAKFSSFQNLAMKEEWCRKKKNAAVFTEVCPNIYSFFSLQMLCECQMVLGTAGKRFTGDKDISWE